MKIALAQLNFHVGNIDSNVDKILNAIAKCKSENVDLVVFSELSVCGYPPKDLLTYPSFVSKCVASIHLIAEHCKEIAAIVGGPSINPSRNGKSLHNSAFFLQDGRITNVVNKSLLPDYDVFDEYRYFEPATSSDIIEFKNRKIALTICEDIWNLGSNTIYGSSPLENLARKQPDFIINIAASPFSKNHQHERLDIIYENIERYNLPLLYVNQVGAQTDLVFDGNSLVIDSDKKIICQFPAFVENISVIELCISNEDTKKFELKFIEKKVSAPRNSTIADCYNALVLGVRDYFLKCNFKTALIGLSGGIDSSLVATIAVDALGSENVTGILMPSEYSSEHSNVDALQLAKNLNINTEKIDIGDIYKSYLNSLTPSFKNSAFNITEENIQARIRGMLLMAFSNKFGNIVLNTTNKSEMAVGYGTLYGDMCGALSVIGDVYKTEVYSLCKFINEKNTNRIPNQILIKEPSAELRPNQKDSDSLPEYNLLDKILFQFIEKQLTAQEIISLGFEEKLILKIIKLVNQSEYKRYQAAPVLRISSKAFGSGRRMPIEGKLNL